MNRIGRLSRVVFDAANAHQLASFYAELTGWPVQPHMGDLILRSPAGPVLAFQPAPDHRPPQWPGQARPTQVHLDLDVDALDAATARTVTLGATERGGGRYWRTFADPAGHPFDLCETSEVAPMSRLWVNIDVPHAPSLASFYSRLLSLDVTHDDDTGSAIGGRGPVTVCFQHVADYSAPRWPDPTHPQQAHLDVLVDDLEFARTQLMELGASHLSESSQRLVLADPAQHPFCLRSRTDIDQPADGLPAH